MQNKKIKLLSIFIVALLMTGLFACLSGNALADPEPTVWVSSVTGKAGETVTFTVSVENNPGISGYGMTLVY
ncbi:MAG: hypothetical protein FWC30_00910, partial [Candidatus Bathyarchaeota archaeon]|nr:hypothetical protein [Candidatus Termiticorpusculum sp.]